jgi:drug/metabolite transporter (DMT)-like permease
VSRRQRRASPADLLVLSAVAVWSVNVIVVKLALRDCPPLLYTAARFPVGGLLLLAAVRLRGHRPRLPRGAAPPAWPWW